MDLYVDAFKARAKLSLQKVASQSRIILGEAYRRKVLWLCDLKQQKSYIEKVVVKNGNIFYQMSDESAILKMNDHGQTITPAEFYEQFLETITLSYPEPQFLTLGDTVVKTEVPHCSFMVAEHFTKKYFFLGRQINLNSPNNPPLYAADISKGAKEVVAEKVDLGKSTKMTALTVDQLTGDIILATREPVTIQSLHKIPYLSEMLSFTEVSTSKQVLKYKY